MEFGHYHLHTNRIIPSNAIKSELLTCFLCQNILWQPEKCSECHTHFCKFCIRFTLLKSKKCPCCLNDYKSSPADHFLFEDLHEIQVRCTFSYNGCNKIIQYSGLLSHESECLFQEKPCEECNEKILKKNYHTHIIFCKNYLSHNLAVDYNQIVGYFKDKLEKTQYQNHLELDKLKKFFSELYLQKEAHLASLIQKMTEQKKILEDIANDRIKSKSTLQNEENRVLYGSDDLFKDRDKRSIEKGKAILNSSTAHTATECKLS